MYKISEIISIPIISLYEGEYQGIIYNIMFDRNMRKCKYACVLNEDDNIQKIIDIGEIYHIGKDCIYIKNQNSLDLECNNDRIISNYISILNLQVFNLKGEKLGISVDVEIDQKYNITSLILNNGNTIESNKIINFGKSIILVDDNIININKFKPKLKTKPSKAKDNKVIILSNKSEQTKTTPIQQSNNKIITDYRFLIGRIIQKDIKAINGELIAKKDSIVTKEIVSRASMYGKLVEISRYSHKKM